jgi:speckle-type POZ protein
MFDEKLSEQTIVVTDISYDTFLSLMKYLYTDECEITLENSITLLKAADLYGIERLKILCEQTISSSIYEANVTTLFMEADRHKAETLRYITMNFILSRFDTVSKLEGFETMMRTRPELAMEIL